jgi:hypothetical protein
MLSILINVNIWLLTIVGFVIYNLYSKNVKLEEIVQRQNQKLETIGQIIEDSDKLVKEVDQLGAFRSDDEVGFFFKALQTIQDTLNNFKNNK